MIDLSFQSAGILDVIFKVSGVALSLIYLAFSFVMIKQVESMKKVLLTDKGGALNMLAYIQFFTALLLLLYSIVIL